LQIVASSLFLQSFKIKDMKKGIHPEYKEVVFWDTSSDFKFLTKSTSFSKETVKWTDGKDYPVIKVEVSSASHPFFTGKKMFLDTAGRVEKFQKKYKKKESEI
jgi:large subunit ribosomal protein L31